MVRISDVRMSGAAFGTVVLHVAREIPEIIETDYLSLFKQHIL